MIRGGMRPRSLRVGILTTAATLALATTCAYGKRPPRSPRIRALEEGITYERRMRGDALTHHVRVDLERWSFFFGAPASDGRHRAQQVSRFAHATGARVAINASFFSPFRAEAPWDYYPHPGDPVETIGELVVDGARSGVPVPEGASLCVRGAATRIVDGPCPPRTRHGVNTLRRLLRDGEVVVHHTERAPRTAVGLDATRRVLHLLVVDGRQPLYSAGTTLRETAEILSDLDVADAIELDGGGSSALFGAGRILNAPLHVRLPCNERPVASHLGIRPRTRSDFPPPRR